jgi:hypothetical protein
MIFYFLLLIFSRFYNLGISSRFIWDESSDLVRMSELYLHPKLTLIGPMSQDGVKIFSSLTYYLTLPFVAIFKFSPVSSAYATAFFGVLTILILFIALKKIKINKTTLTLSLILFLISFPLLESSRWAWNPHFIPFWQSLAVLFLSFNLPVLNIFAGLFMGATIHHHWYAVFSGLGIGFKKIYYYLGIFIAILPFIIFDLTHPPGLFLSRALFFSPISPTNNSFNLAVIYKIPLQFFTYLSGNNTTLGFLVLILSIFLIIKNKKKINFTYLIPVIFQLLGLMFIKSEVFTHYLLPAVLFFYFFIIVNANKIKIFNLILICLILSNLFSLKKIFFQNDWSTNINAINEITNIIESQSKQDKAKFNIAVLSSPDPNTKGQRFRDLLRLRKIDTAPDHDYQNINQVYFLSYASWDKLIQDPSYEISNFRNSKPISTWPIKNSSWILYKVQKN